MQSEGVFGSRSGQAVDLSRQRDLGEILRIAWSAYRGHFAVMLSIAALQAAMELVLTWGPSGSTVSSPLTSAIFLFFIGQVTTGALIYAGNEAFMGGAPAFQRSFEAIRPRIRALLTTGLLGGVLALVSLIAFPYFAVRWALSSQAVVLEGNGNWAALDASSSLVRGHWWRVFGVLLLLNVVWLLSIPVVVTTTLSGVDTAITAILSSVVMAVVRPFTVLAGTLLYYDLKARHRDADAESPGSATPAGE